MSSDLYIPKHLFDWDYYVAKNPDIKKAGFCDLEKAYRHWILYGCYENRWVRSTATGHEQQVKLKPNEKFTNPSPLTSQPQAPTRSVYGPKPVIDLGFKVAIMIHVFDVYMMRFFISYINYLAPKYLRENFDIYFNIVEEDTPYQGTNDEFHQYMTEQLKLISNPVVRCQYSENRGGDIGGFLLLSKTVITSGIDYKYAVFIHSKTKAQWRKDLCHCIFDLPFDNLEKFKTATMGLISAKKWIYTFNSQAEYRRYQYHMIELCSIYDLDSTQSWQFVAGTMFLSRIEIIRYIVDHDIDRVYGMLNRVESVDVNWQNIVGELRKDTRGTTNDYQYRIRYRKSVCSDYMIEHTFERIIGLICQHLGYKLIGGDS